MHASHSDRTSWSKWMQINSLPFWLNLQIFHHFYIHLLFKNYHPPSTCNISHLFENVACVLVGVHPRQLWFISTNKKRNNNRTFVKLNVYCKFHQFTVFQPEDWPWQFYAHRTSSLMNSLHEHCHLSTADNSCPAQCYIPNDSPPENQTQQLDHSVNCDNDWDTPHFSKQPCKNIHLFIHSFYLFETNLQHKFSNK